MCTATTKRAGRRGAKSSPNRALPIHPALSREMNEWGARSGEVFKAPVSDQGHTDRYFTGGEATREAFRTAWAAAGVPEDRWGVNEGELQRGERAHGSPTNAIRAGVKVHLLRCGFRESLVDYLIGHSRGSTDGAYVPQTAPTTSPLWGSLQEAIAAIPDHDPKDGRGQQAGS